MNNKPSGFTYTGEDFEPNTITFNSSESTWVMQITADRKIIVNEGVEVSDAAQSVLNALEPLLLKTHPVKELTDEEIIAVGNAVVNHIDSNEGWIEFARAILRKASEK
jgi:hypothetical protein